ncbi:hypothetical protein ABZ614_05815 [Streptomyces sp. NPDC013178]|uniref:hypothetical protein n=1 Tax=Streptomyces sp. NPDC013178 TaxID=3155118 RepID=UPI003408B0BE
MHHVARTAPGTGSTRPPAVAVLTAVVLVLLAALGIAGPPPGATGEPPGTAAPATGAASAAGRHWDTGPRADDGCDTACTVRAATRQESHSEHPAPRGCLVTCGQGTDATVSQRPWPPAPTWHLPSSEPHAAHDRGRAPPAFSGT